MHFRIKIKFVVLLFLVIAFTSLKNLKSVEAVTCWRANCGGFNRYFHTSAFVDASDCQVQGMTDYCAGAAWVSCSSGNYCSY